MSKIQLLKYRAAIASVILYAATGHAADDEKSLSTAMEAKALADTEVTELAEAEDPKNPKQAEPSEYDLYHTIRNGDNLWELAELLTGDANNWKALAKANELDELGTVRPGQTIHIPASFSKVAIKSVTLVTSAQPAVKVKADKADVETASVTIPATFKDEPTVYLYEESKVKVSD